jgi:PhnB protein
MVIYLFFNGNCEEAMNFYKTVLGGEILSISRYGDTPMPGSEDYKDKVMHGIMQVAGTTMMFSDSSEQKKTVFGDNFSISIDCKSDGEITSAFEAMSKGGTVTMPLQDTFWGAKFGMCCDKFGVNWMFNFDKPKTENS